MKAEMIRARSNVPISSFLDKLRQITAEEFDVAKRNSAFQYYGKIRDDAFDIRHVRYSLYSSGPSIEGEIKEKSKDETLLNISIDMDDHHKYANKILAVSVVVIALMAVLALLGGSVDKLTSLIVFGILIIFSICYVMMMKFVLNSRRKNELKKFLEITDSTLV